MFLFGGSTAFVLWFKEEFGMKKIIFPLACLVVVCAFAEEKYQIRPSVWGTEKWYGGYEVHSKDKKIGEIRPSVWVRNAGRADMNYIRAIKRSGRQRHQSGDRTSGMGDMMSKGIWQTS